MNKSTLLIFPLLLISFAAGTWLISLNKPMKCLDTYSDFNSAPSSDVLDAFYSVLQAPTEPTPETYPIRKIGSVLHGEKAHLVLVHFYKSTEDTSLEYAEAFNYFPETKKAEAIESPVTQNPEKRMYLPQVTQVTCGMQMNVDFSSCDACGEGGIYKLVAKYFPDEGKWAFDGPVFSEIQSEGSEESAPASSPALEPAPEAGAEVTPASSGN